MTEQKKIFPGSQKILPPQEIRELALLIVFQESGHAII